MHLWTKKSLLNFVSHPDLDPYVRIFKMNFYRCKTGAIRQILREVFEGCNADNFKILSQLGLFPYIKAYSGLA